MLGAIARTGLSVRPPEGELEIAGADPVLGSPHHLGEGAAVARALTGLGANDLWELRTGRRQRLRVDVAHAAASLSSFAYLKLFDPPPGAGSDPRRFTRFTRIVPAAGGRFFQMHGSFGDGPALLDLLGLEPEASNEDVDRAVAGRDAFGLEEECIERRICGGVVRSPEEWARHRQGQALNGLPLIRITRIGNSPVEPLPPGPRPLSGVRVLDLTRVLAGPTCAKTLAEHGAEILHVGAPHLSGTGLFDIETGIGKRQAYIDLDQPDQSAVLKRLIQTGDVFSQGYRRGSLERRGYGPKALAELRPGIVYVSENCYGPVGPWADRPGWEQLAQAATGMSWQQGVFASGPPRLAPAAVNDYTTGFLAAYGTMLALARRATEGGSWHVETSLSQTSMWYQSLGDPLPASDVAPLDVRHLRAEMSSHFYGPLRYLTPALWMSETRPRWDLPPAPAGTHPPAWPDRRAE